MKKTASPGPPLVRGLRRRKGGEDSYGGRPPAKESVSRRGPLTCLSVVRLLPLAAGEVRANPRQKNGAFKSIEDCRDLRRFLLQNETNIITSDVGHVRSIRRGGTQRISESARYSTCGSQASTQSSVYHLPEGD